MVVIKKLGPHESVHFQGVIPANATANAICAHIHLEATCACGGQVIPHPTKRLVWICERSHWWNRRKHSYLTGSVEIMPAPEGEA